MKLTKKINIVLVTIALGLTACSNGSPSTSEVKELIVKEGIESGQEQIKSILYDYFRNTAYLRYENFRRTHVTEDAYGGIHGFQAMSKLQQIKDKLNLIEVNKNNIGKAVEHFIDIKSVDCSQKKGFDKFYDCSVNTIITNNYDSVLRTFNISFHRMDDGSLGEMSTSDFYIPDGMNIFTSLTRLNSKNYFMNISPKKETIDPNNDSNFYIKNKKMYFDLMNDLKSVELN